MAMRRCSRLSATDAEIRGRAQEERELHPGQVALVGVALVDLRGHSGPRSTRCRPGDPCRRGLCRWPFPTHPHPGCRCPGSKSLTWSVAYNPCEHALCKAIASDSPLERLPRRGPGPAGASGCPGRRRGPGRRPPLHRRLPRVEERGECVVDVGLVGLQECRLPAEPLQRIRHDRRGGDVPAIVPLAPGPAAGPPQRRGGPVSVIQGRLRGRLGEQRIRVRELPRVQQAHDPVVVHVPPRLVEVHDSAEGRLHRVGELQRPAGTPGAIPKAR